MGLATRLRGAEWWIWKQRRAGSGPDGRPKRRTVYPERILVGAPDHERVYLPCRFAMTDEQMAAALDALPQDDPERSHMFADVLLLSFLRGCGYKQSALAFGRLRRYYS